MTTSSFRFDRVMLTLVLSVALFYVVPFVPFLYDHILSVIIAFMALIALLAAVKKAWVDVGLAVFVAAAFGLGRLKYDVIDTETFVLRTAAILAFVLLHVTLLIGPWSRFTKLAQRFYTYRRHIGVTAFLLAWLHSSTVLRVFFEFDIKSAWMLVYTFFGFTSLFIMALLAFSSWDWIQKNVKYRVWVAVHVLALGVYLFAMRVMKQQVLDLLPWQSMLLWGFVALWMLLAPWSLARLMHKRVNGWKQLHRLIYIGYISLIVHVWYAYVASLEGWIPTVFWLCVVAVGGSHAAGWVMALVQWAVRRSKKAATITIDEKTYHFTDRVETFVEGKGRKFVVANIPVAVFLFQGKFFAMANACPHQGGPICDGKIVNGYVECPWHKYQFGVEDGIGPPEFKDCIPYYPVIVQNNAVYVSEQDTGKCKTH